VLCHFYVSVTSISAGRSKTEILAVLFGYSPEPYFMAALILCIYRVTDLLKCRLRNFACICCPGLFAKTYWSPVRGMDAITSESKPEIFSTRVPLSL
jgi:hypothetical protein